MASAKSTCLISLSLLMSVQIAHGQPVAWQKLTNDADAAAKKHDAVNAERFYLAALAQARMSYKKDAELAMSLNNLGNFYSSEKKFDDAMPMLEEALEVLTSQVGHTHAYVASELNNIANCLYGAKKYAESESYFKKAIAACPKVSSAQKDLLPSLTGVIGALSNQNRMTEAKPFAKQAVAIADGNPSFPAANLANAYSASAACYASLNDLKTAESLLQKAVAFDQRAYGRNSQQAAVDTSNLVNVKQRMGVRTNATPQETVYRPSSPSTSANTSDESKIASLSTLANEAANKNQFDQAADYLKQALTLAEKDSSDENENLMQIRNSLACVYLNQNKYQDAEQLLFAAIAQAQNMKTPPQDFIATATNNIGNTLFKEKKYDEAEMMLKQSVDATTKLKGPADSETGTSIANLATVYGAAGRYDEAKSYFDQAIQVLEKTGAKGELRNCYQNYANVMQSSGDQSTASQLAAKAQNIH